MLGQNFYTTLYNFLFGGLKSSRDQKLTTFKPYLSIFEGSDERAAKTPVKVVPTFPPNKSGYSFSKVTTPMPTRGVKTVRNTSEDCIYNLTIQIRGMS